MKIATCSFVTFLCVLASGVIVIRSQSAPSLDGIKSYQSGDFSGAIQHLKDSQDPVGLRFLGLSYEALGKKKEAAKSFELSLKNGYSAFESSFADWRTAKGSSFAGILKNLSEVLPASVASAENAVRLKADIVNDNEWRFTANVIQNLKQVESSGVEFYHFSEVDSDAKILSQPRPAISPADCVARLGLDAKILLDVLFFPDGRTILVVPLSKWKKRCSEASIMAAMQIQFEPAKKNGKAVGSVKTVEYSFAWR